MAIADNTTKINQLIAKINSLPVAGSGTDSSGTQTAFSPKISVESVDGGHNIKITDIDGEETFFIPDGTDGTDGTDGVGISSIEQTTTSTKDGGENVITATLSNGDSSEFKIRNGSTGSSGVGITKVEQTVTSKEDGGENKITVTLSNNDTYDFKIKNGSKGTDGPNGVGISNITQVDGASNGGQNEITVTLTNGSTPKLYTKNGRDGAPGGKGDPGDKGDPGESAKINGVNALTITTSGGIKSSQSENGVFTISTSLTDLLAAGPIYLKEGVDFHYGNTLPPSGTEGRLFFLKK